MAGLIAAQFIDDLLARIDIVDIIQQRVPLKKAGREWTACCPFHDERTPSFTVSPHKQFYHCFGCGQHGSAIGFLMDYEHLGFQDAVEELAQHAGLEVIYESGNKPSSANHQATYAMLETVSHFFHTELGKHTQAQRYCQERGINIDASKPFRLGFAAAGWDHLIKAFASTPEKLKILDQAGLLSSNSQGHYYDKFRDRLMFPIMDRRGRVVAFGGRVMQADQKPKYLNSPETAVFHKSRELFGLWQVKQANSKLDRLIVVEGYMDVLALHQAGLPIAVATLGTTTTEEHTERLFRTVSHVTFCFDGDRAGRDAAWKALEASLPHMREGRQASFLFLPDGEDPDSLIKAQGQERFQARIDQATSLATYFFAHLSEGIQLDVLDGKARLAELAKPLIARIPSGAFRDLMRNELSRLTGYNATLPEPSSTPAQAPAGSTKPSLIRSTITLLLNQPDLVQKTAIQADFKQLAIPGMELLQAIMQTAQTKPGLTTAQLLEAFRDHPHAKSLYKLAAMDIPDSVNLEDEFAGAIQQLNEQAAEQRLSALRKKQKQLGLSAQDKQELRELLYIRSQSKA